ncbi:Crp/Fnr family transcriptional regulator [Winogradskyella vincentii]|uniref:Crp/Fnr family transcriptional regulator n=1 Tax=Winogradskyella vincentii TaxID=2877122 RepID=A0ABS7Y3K4_9FLAO|nr:Crp/Fnr family transcriptional regulator [Winogradskyella vincentii]MCA0154507.1 Crp/Fnr family transcriptional regulator [Winogradskyella vincentii]
MHIEKSEVSEIFKGLELKDHEIEFIKTVLHKKNYSKGALIIKNGVQVDQTFGVKSGCLRTYHVDKVGKEHTLQFAIKGWWITDYTSFFLKSKAIMNLEVIQDAVVYQLSFQDREELFKKIPTLESFIRTRLENSYAAFQKRVLGNLSKTAKERYLDFISTYPNIEKRVKNYHIASYLGITTESLSRIRRELTQI